MRIIAIIDDSVVIISNSALATSDRAVQCELPKLYYYDQHFIYRLNRYGLLRYNESITNVESELFSSKIIMGLSVSPSGEVETHVISVGDKPINDIADRTVVEQVRFFQGNLAAITNSWFGGDSYVTNALSLYWTTNKRLDPVELFEVLKPAIDVGGVLTIYKIKKEHLLISIDMANSGVALSEIDKLWEVTTYVAPVEVIATKLSDLRELNTTNLAHVTQDHVVPKD